MCKPLSAIVLHADSGVEVFCDDHTDSHEVLIAALGLNDSECQRYRGRKWCRIEYTWPTDATGETIADQSAWLLRVDEDESVPWWTEEVAARVRVRVAAIAAHRIITDKRGTLLGGAWIVAAGGSVAAIVGGRVLFGSSADLSDANLRSANLSSADLSSANLSSADLRSADLYGANLRSADLRSANLRSADLRSADLRGANLSSADLRSANLSSADLSSANLSSADLSSANLSSADLRSADLRSANLRSADLRSADLRSADLSSANLSSADLSTCYRLASDAEIPGWIVVDGRLARRES